MTDDLIARLATDLKPVRPNALPRLLLGTVMASGVVAAIAMLARGTGRPRAPYDQIILIEER